MSKVWGRRLESPKLVEREEGGGKFCWHFCGCRHFLGLTERHPFRDLGCIEFIAGGNSEIGINIYTVLHGTGQGLKQHVFTAYIRGKSLSSPLLLRDEGGAFSSSSSSFLASCRPGGIHADGRRAKKKRRHSANSYLLFLYAAAAARAGRCRKRKHRQQKGFSARTQLEKKISKWK